MTEPTSSARDSSRWDRKAPGNVSLSNLAAPPGQCSESGGQTPWRFCRPGRAKRWPGPITPVVKMRTASDYGSPPSRGRQVCSPNRHAVAEALVELFGDAFDTLGRRIKGADHRI